MFGCESLALIAQALVGLFAGDVVEKDKYLELVMPGKGQTVRSPIGAG
jgi:hypothetical protein